MAESDAPTEDAPADAAGAAHDAAVAADRAADAAEAEAEAAAVAGEAIEAAAEAEQARWTQEQINQLTAATARTEEVVVALASRLDQMERSLTEGFLSLTQQAEQTQAMATAAAEIAAETAAAVEAPDLTSEAQPSDGETTSESGEPNDAREQPSAETARRSRHRPRI